MKLTKNNLIKSIINISKILKREEKYLCSLDQKIGDGDHGTNMLRGFNEVIKLNFNNLNIREVFFETGNTLLNTVGGSSGPLYGMSFINASEKISENIMEEKDFKIFVENTCFTLEDLGQSNLNDKTMYDVWKNLSIFLNTFPEKWTNEIIEEIILKVKKLSDSTKDMIAKKGRASYLQNRSKGTIDPGSVSSVYIISEFLKGFKND